MTISSSWRPCGDEVAALVDERPDLVLLDHRMPGADGIACLKVVRQHHPEIKVVMLSASEDSAQIGEALAAGASAYIGKRINPDDFASTLRQVVAGVVYQTAPDVDLDDRTEPAVATAASELTGRELTMLDAISRGLSTKMISRELWISEKTVKFHLTNIYRKLGVHTAPARCGTRSSTGSWRRLRLRSCRSSRPERARRPPCPRAVHVGQRPRRMN